MANININNKKKRSLTPSKLISILAKKPSIPNKPSGSLITINNNNPIRINNTINSTIYNNNNNSDRYLTNIIIDNQSKYYNQIIFDLESQSDKLSWAIFDIIKDYNKSILELLDSNNGCINSKNYNLNNNELIPTEYELELINATKYLYNIKRKIIPLSIDNLKLTDKNRLNYLLTKLSELVHWYITNRKKYNLKQKISNKIIMG